jgi:hypothetical protein
MLIQVDVYLDRVTLSCIQDSLWPLFQSSLQYNAAQHNKAVPRIWSQQLFKVRLLHAPVHEGFPTLLARLVLSSTFLVSGCSLTRSGLGFVASLQKVFFFSAKFQTWKRVKNPDQCVFRSTWFDYDVFVFRVSFQTIGGIWAGEGRGNAALCTHSRTSRAE